MKNQLGIVSAVLLALSGSASAGTFSLTTSPAAGDNADVLIGQSTDVTIYFTGDGDTQDAQMDFSLSDFTNLTISANTLVGGSTCAFDGVSLLRVAPPSGAGTALTSTPTAYCSFTVTVAPAQTPEVRAISTSLLDCAPLGVGDVCEFVGNGINIIDTPPTSQTVTSSGNAGGTVMPPSQDVNSGSSAMVTITPNAGFQIASIGGTCGGTPDIAPPTSSAVTYTTDPVGTAGDPDNSADCTVTATFEAIPAPIYASTPAPGSTRNCASGGTTSVNIQNTGDLMMNVSCSIGGSFSSVGPSATIAPGANSDVTVTCPTVAEGDPPVNGTLVCSSDGGPDASYPVIASAIPPIPPAIPGAELIPASSLWSKLMLFGFLAGLGALVISLRRS